jgi:hypothetical protein
MHHFGVMSTLVPAASWVDIPTTQQVIEYYLPEALQHLQLTTQQVSLITINSALWVSTTEKSLEQKSLSLTVSASSLT